MSEFGWGINELDLKFMAWKSFCLWNKWLSDGNNSFSWSNNATSEHEEILIDYTVMGETTDWCNIFDMWILFCWCVINSSSDCTSSNSVNLLIHSGSVEVTEITSSSDSPLDGSWMPSSNTSNLSETSMCLSWKSWYTPSLNDSLSSFTSCNGNCINHFIVFEYFSNGNFLFEFGDSPVDFLHNVSTVYLDFSKMSFSLSKLNFFNLSSSKYSDNAAVFFNSLNVSVDMFLWFSVFLISFGVVCKSLFLCKIVVLVESSNDCNWKILCPDSRECSETSWSINISD